MFHKPRNPQTALVSQTNVNSLFFPGGGVLTGKVGTGMCGPDRVLFRPLGFSNGPFFYLKIGLDISRVFAKCLIFDLFLWFTYRLSKITYASQFTWLKTTDWFEQGPLQEPNGLDIGYKFAPSLV